MPQKTSPFLEGKWGWDYAEDGWNVGADENWLKFSYMFDRNVDGIVSSLPPAVNGTAYFNTVDNRFYFVVDGTYYSSPCPKWFVFTTRGTGDTYQFNGSSVAQVPTNSSLGSRLDAVELTLTTTLPAPTGASLVGFQQAGVNTVARDLQARGRDSVSIADYPNATVDASDAITKMATDYGFVRIPFGIFPILNTVTISVPITFELGASINAAAGITVNINNSIESPRQFIFRGLGSYALGHSHVTDTGENARQIHISWFGAFPNPDYGPDQSPFFQKAFNSMGNGRESEILMDIGNYNVDSSTIASLVMTRACHLKGCGQRRTVFKSSTDTGPVLRTGNTACRISGIGFELHAGFLSTRTNPFIQIDHDLCDVYDVSFGNTDQGLIINALSCRVDGVIAGYAANQSAGSSLIWAKSGNATIKNVYCMTSSGFGPEQVIRLGNSVANNESAFFVDNIISVLPSKVVYVDATVGSVTNSIISNIRYTGFAGTAPDAVVHLKTAADRNISAITINNIVGTSYATNFIKIEQTSTGSTKDVVINNAQSSGGTGYGIGFIQTAGTLSDITVSSSVNVKHNATPFFYSGSYSNIEVSPIAVPGALPSICYDATLLDDTAIAIDLHRSVFTGFVVVTSSYQNCGQYVIRAASTPNLTAIQQTANMANTTGVLSGTTGVDGKLTFSVADRTLYVENRLGSTQRVSINLMTGVS